MNPVASQIIVLHQSASRIEASLFEGTGVEIATRSCLLPTTYPRRGWVEHSASAIWRSVQLLVDEIVQITELNSIASIAISSDPDTVVVWEAETGEPVSAAIGSRCTRSAKICERLIRDGYNADVVARGGRSLGAHYQAGKIAWALDRDPCLRARAEADEIKVGSIGSWLLWKLTGGRLHAVDHGMAAHSQLFNLNNLCWDPLLAELFRIPMKALPKVLASDSRFGEVAPGVTALPPGAPIHAMLIDTHAAMFAEGVNRPGQAKVTLCAGNSNATAIAQERICSFGGLSSAIAWSEAGKVAHTLCADLPGVDDVMDLTVELLNLRTHAEFANLADLAQSSEGVCFVPAAFGVTEVGRTAEARGAVTGVNKDTPPEHIARAAHDVIAMQVNEAIEAMECDLGYSLSSVVTNDLSLRQNMQCTMGSHFAEVSISRAAAGAAALGAAKMASAALARSGRPKFSPTESEQAKHAGWTSQWEKTIFPPSVH